MTKEKKDGIIKGVETEYAAVAELADARDLKSRGKKFPYRFDPGQRQKFFYEIFIKRVKPNDG